MFDKTKNWIKKEVKMVKFYSKSRYSAVFNTASQIQLINQSSYIYTLVEIRGLAYE